MRLISCWSAGAATVVVAAAATVAAGCGPTTPQAGSAKGSGGRGAADAGAERPRPAATGGADAGNDRGGISLPPYPALSEPMAGEGCGPGVQDGGRRDGTGNEDGGDTNRAEVAGAGSARDAGGETGDGQVSTDSRPVAARDGGYDGASGSGGHGGASGWYPGLAGQTGQSPQGSGTGAGRPGDASGAGAGGALGSGGVLGNGGVLGSGSGDGMGGGGGASERGEHVPAPRPGELAMVELLINPAGTDTGREWIEIVNRATHAVSLLGLHLADAGNDAAVEFELTGAPFLAPGGRAVLIQSADPTKNGGVTLGSALAGGTFGTLVSLNNEADQISLCLGSCTTGLLIDTISWDSTLGPQYEGHALVLGQDGHRCPATQPFGDAGSFGTPGSQNQPCP